MYTRLSMTIASFNLVRTVSIGESISFAAVPPYIVYIIWLENGCTCRCCNNLNQALSLSAAGQQLIARPRVTRRQIPNESHMWVGAQRRGRSLGVSFHEWGATLVTGGPVFFY